MLINNLPILLKLFLIFGFISGTKVAVKKEDICNGISQGILSLINDHEVKNILLFFLEFG